MLAAILIGFLGFGFNQGNLQANMQKLKVTVNDGIQIIQTKSYPVFTDVSWTEIKAAGFKVTQTSLDGFLQLCQRLSVNLGNFKVYADVECRVLWVYCPSQDATNAEAYYVQFT